MTPRRIGSLLAAAILCVSADAARAKIDPFYLDLEHEAQVMVVRGDAAAAARLYRVACFGMLDEPARVAACTVRLAKTQAAAKDLEGFRASYLRLATVEERLQGLTRSEVALEEKQELGRLAASRLTPEELALIPELAAMVAAERAAQVAAAAAAKPQKSKPKSRRKASEAPLVPETPAGEVSPQAPPPLGQLVTEESPPADAPGGSVPSAPPPANDVSVDSAADQDRLELARKRMGERPDRQILEAELATVRAIAERNADDVVAARLTGDLAYLLGLWPTCADYYQRAGDPGPEQPLGRFYMAVCLYETGQTESAVLLIAPSADRLKRSPFVDGYLERILGRSGPP